MNRRAISVVAVALLAGAVIVLAVLHLRPGVQVTVQNTGNQTMHAVELSATGTWPSLGDIAPGESATIRVNPTGESGLGIRFADAKGDQKQLYANLYFERGYRGTFHVAVKDGVIEKQEQEIKAY